MVLILIKLTKCSKRSGTGDYLSPESRQVKEGTFECEVNHRIESLFTGEC